MIHCKVSLYGSHNGGYLLLKVLDRAGSSVVEMTGRLRGLQPRYGLLPTLFLCRGVHKKRDIRDYAIFVFLKNMRVEVNAH